MATLFSRTADYVKERVWWGLGGGCALYAVVGAAVASATRGRLDLNKTPVIFLCLLLGLLVVALQALRRARTDEWHARKAREWEAQAPLREAQALDRARQSECREGLIRLSQNAIATLETLPRRLADAESFLDRAEADFAERAFAPFWDSIERATLQIGGFNDDVGRLAEMATRHTQLRREYRGESEPFPLTRSSAERAGVASGTTDRLTSLVRQGQRDFQFALIYEQRKTNQLLIAGFTTLASALDGMGRRLAASIEGLAGAVAESADSLQQSLQGVQESVQASGAGVEQAVRDAGGELRARGDRALEMLDNIQRRRMPRPRGLRDGEY